MTVAPRRNVPVELTWILVDNNVALPFPCLIGSWFGDRWITFIAREPHLAGSRKHERWWWAPILAPPPREGGD